MTATEQWEPDRENGYLHPRSLFRSLEGSLTSCEYAYTYATLYVQERYHKILLCT